VGIALAQLQDSWSRSGSSTRILSSCGTARGWRRRHGQAAEREACPFSKRACGQIRCCPGCSRLQRLRANSLLPRLL